MPRSEVSSGLIELQNLGPLLHKWKQKTDSKLRFVCFETM